MLQDAVITMRDGRYCLPVRAEYKSQFAGMVHDQSATGSTLFIEPMAIIKLNNELRELELKEEKENLIKKVLDDAGIEELQVGAFTVRFTNVVRNGFNTSAFKKKYLELYNAFIKQSSYRKFSIS